MDKIKTLLVTGGAGYVGSNTINLLFCKYPNITFVVVDLKKTPHFINKNIRKSNRFVYYQENIGNNTKIMKILNKHRVKYVLDLASFLPYDLTIISQSEFIANNTICRNNFFNTCIAYGKIKHIIYQSTLLAVTNSSDLNDSSANIYPLNKYNHILYTTTKTTGLSLAYNTLILKQLPITLVSPAHIYGGENQPKGDTLLSMIHELCNTGKITLEHNSATNYDNWIDILNVIEAYEIIFNQGFNQLNYNLLNQSQYFTTKQTAEMIIYFSKNSTDYNNYLNYDESILTPIPNSKKYNIKSNFPSGVFKTNNTFEIELKKIAKCN